jgi:hypothetical protein
LAKNRKQIARGTRYLAVKSYPVFLDEISNLYAKLLTSPGANSSDLEDLESNKELRLDCLNMLDMRTQKLVSAEGYGVADSPERGRVAQFGPCTAVYIGNGD